MNDIGLEVETTTTAADPTLQLTSDQKNLLDYVPDNIPVTKIEKRQNVDIKKELSQAPKTEAPKIERRAVSSESSGEEEVNKVDPEELSHLTDDQKKLMENFPVHIPVTKKRIKIKKIMFTQEECLKEKVEAAKNQNYIDSELKCTDCVKHFTFKDSFDKHMELHSEARGEYECDICKMRFHQVAGVADHKYNIHFLRYKCPECDLVRKLKSTIWNHYDAHHTDRKEQYQCLICDKKYINYATLRGHMKQNHSNKIHMCPHCGKTLSSQKSLRWHINKIHNKEETKKPKPRTFICDICGSAFQTKFTLAAHLNTHDPTKKYYCIECDKYFTREDTLDYHYRTAAPHVTDKDLKYQCPQCDKRFALRCLMNCHMKRRHGSERYKCDKCDKVYKQKGGLNRHKIEVHDGVKRPLIYTCPACDKKFSRTSVLRMHLRTHTGDRPFQCPACPTSFTHRGAMNKHMIRHPKSFSQDLD